MKIRGYFFCTKQSVKAIKQYANALFSFSQIYTTTKTLNAEYESFLFLLYIYL